MSANSLRLDSSAIPNWHPGPHLTSDDSLNSQLAPSCLPVATCFSCLCRRADGLYVAHFSAEGLLLRNSAYVAALQPWVCDRLRENDSFCRPDFSHCSVQLPTSYMEAEMRRFKSEFLTHFHLPAATHQEHYVNFFFK